MYRCLKLLDPMVICPYDKNHFITKSRLQKHIVKCEKQYPEHYKVMCPYNATHRLFKSEIEEHIITCPTRSVLESEMYSEPRKHGTIDFALQSEISSTIDSSENWDLKLDDNSTTFTNEKSVPNNIYSYKKTFDSSQKNNIIDKEHIRAPRGLSEAMLREENEDSCVEDVESVISAMGIGRGKIAQEKDRLRLIGLGRGRPFNTNY